MRIIDWISDVCSSDLVCLDARTGNPVWRTPVHLPAWGNPLVVGDRVYIGLGNGRLNESVRPPETPEIGRASSRQRVCQYVMISADYLSLNKQIMRNTAYHTNNQQQNPTTMIYS